MKKASILLFIAIFFFSISPPAYAQIYRKVTPSKTIIQSENIGNVTPLNVVTFQKSIHNPPIVHTFGLMVFKGDSDYWKFSRQPAILTIQGKDYPLDFIAAQEHYDVKLGCISMAMFFILGDYADALSDADYATITFHFDNKPDITWDIPNSVLLEWKQVIEMK